MFSVTDIKVLCKRLRLLCQVHSVHAFFSTSLLPVLVEEEESVQDSAADAPAVVDSMAGGKKTQSLCMREGRERNGEYFQVDCLFMPSYIYVCVSLSTHTSSFLLGTDQLTSSGATTFSDSSSPQSGSSVIHANQSGKGSVTSDPSQLEDSASAAKTDTLPQHGKKKKELVRPALLPLSSKLGVGWVVTHINFQL